MSTLINEVDARTKLAGANQMELLLFQLGSREVYGINVFKVREVMKRPELTRVPEADPRVEGMANIRGTMVPVVGLTKALKVSAPELMQEATDEDTAGNLIITEFNMSLQAFHVASVDRILRLSWTQIKTPPALLRDSSRGAVTSVAMLENGQMVLILDVEKVLADICPRPDDEVYAGMSARPVFKSKRILFADDSNVARTQIRKALERLGITYIQTTTGQEAWDTLLQLADKATSEGKPIVNEISMVLSDIEMPDMDGFTLTKHIRNDPRFANLPVILHSSLTGTCNTAKGRAVGATDYVTKFDPKMLGATISKYCA
jgi:two-component system chemotaxis response regulator CheV